MSDVLAIFCRAPELGKVKTRLAASLGEQKSLEFYVACLRDTFQKAREIQSLNVEIVPLITPDDADLSEFWRGKTQNQGNGDLWSRILRADAILRENGAKNVVFIGSDSPDLPTLILKAAFYFLGFKRDFVVGPSEDGGFYLLGASKPLCEAIFQNVPISSSKTLEILRPRLGEAVLELPKWSDVDEIGDLEKLRARLENGESKAPFCAAFFADNKKSGPT